MPSLETKLSFLANLPLYEEEKPYLVLLPPDAALDPSVPLSNLAYETHDVCVQDIRPELDSHRIEDCGFQVLDHESTVVFPENIEAASLADVENYKRETENMLKESLDAKHVVCYDFRVS